MRAAGFVVFVLLILSSCLQFKPPTDGTISNLPLDSSDGLKVSFLPGEPPDEVFVSDRFGISLDIENLGEHSLTKEEMRFFILGINPATFNLNGRQNSFDLSAELGENVLRGSGVIGNRLIMGGRTTKSFRDLMYLGAPVVSEQLFTLSVLACYHYSSQTSFKVCLNKGVLREALNSRVCQVDGIRELTPSRSPVKIVSAEQISSSDRKIRVKLVVQNLGGGTVLFKSSDVADDASSDINIDSLFDLTKCLDAQRSEQNRVNIIGELEAGDLIPFTCSPEKVFLIDRIGEVICTAELPEGEQEIARGNYEMVAKFKLEYSYAQATEKDIIIVGESD